MSKIYHIAKLTVIENIKRKNFIILFIYIGVVLGSGFFFSMLSPQHEIRVILDLGTSSIEIFAFLSAAFISIGLLRREIEDKTLYLILSRPVPRISHLAGRFLGLLTVSLIYIVIMTAALAGMLLIKGWTWNMFIVEISFFIFLKVLIVIALSMLLSLITTSSATSFVSIFFLWTVGHFIEEIKYLAREAAGFISVMVAAVYYITPNFSRLNYKDVFHAVGVNLGVFVSSAGYSVFYAASVFVIAAIIFTRKEL